MNDQRMDFAVTVAPTREDGVTTVIVHAIGCPNAGDLAIPMTRRVMQIYIEEVRRHGVRLWTCTECQGLGDDGF